MQSVRGAETFLVRSLGAVALVAIWLVGPAIEAAELKTPRVPPEVAQRLSQRVKIYRDSFGTPHIDGADDEAVIFGFAYAQAEDYFWQLEDTYILALGRYSEVHGPRGLNSDLLNRAFEITTRSQADYPHLELELQKLLAAFAAGVNYYLDTHPDVHPRKIDRFEPWHVVAFGRHLMLEMTFRYTRLHNNYLPRSHPLVHSFSGSNAVAIAPKRTRDGHALLLVAPHQPQFGFGQFYEAHLRSGEGWNFTGAAFFGSPIPGFGHNDHLGWGVTTNEPDIADTWRVTFDDPNDPLRYRYGNDYRKARQWQVTIPVRRGNSVVEQPFTLRATHHGPIVAQDDDGAFLAARIAGLHEVTVLRQAIQMVRARNLDEFRRAVDLQQFPLMNLVYADREGQIYYLYNGLVPRRDPQFDYRRPLDGAEPRTEWGGILPVAELPQVVSPQAGYVQNCNSSPFTVCLPNEIDASQFPRYLAEDADFDHRRAHVARYLIESEPQWTFEKLQALAFDTTNWWAREELPRFRRQLEQLAHTDPELAAKARPYLEHLLEWDGRTSLDCTAAPLCHAWYEIMYGNSYPGNEPREPYRSDPRARFRALVLAANALRTMHGDWRIPWGEVYRLQRHANVAELTEIPFSDTRASLPCLGAHGPMGVFFTQYYTPSVVIPFVRQMRKRYAVVGCAYLGVYEFGPRVRGASLLPFGSSGDPQSPHYFDQAELYSAGRFKTELFDWRDVVAHCSPPYHPGETRTAAAR